MAADQQPQTCDAVDELDYGIWFECGLLPGHAGDHEILHTWENKPIGPELAATRNRLLPEGWAKSLGEAFARRLLAPPVEPRTLVVNRDLEG